MTGRYRSIDLNNCRDKCRSMRRHSFLECSFLRLFVFCFFFTVQIKTIADNDTIRRYNYFYLEAIRQQQLGNHAAAFDLLSHARELCPNAAEVYFQLSSYYVDLKNDSMARASFEKAAQLSPDNAIYQERLGQFYITQKEFEKAIASYEQLYQRNHNRLDVLQILLRMYNIQNDYQQMISTLDRMETLEGSSEQITLAKMQVYEQQGEQDKVLKELTSLVEKHPNELNYRVMLGNWLLQNDKEELALKEFKAVLKEEPDHEAALTSMIDYYHTIHKDKDAENILTRLLLNKKTSSDTKLTLIRQSIIENKEDSVKIFGLFDKALSLPQEDTGILSLKAAYMDLRKMPADSINLIYEQILDIEPDNAQACFQLIRNTWDKKDFDKVINLCAQAQQYNPDEMAFYYFQGLAHVQKDQDDEALETLRKGVSQINKESDPDIVSDFYAIMGDILHKKKLYKESYEAYDSCLQWKPDNIACLNNYAYYLSLEEKDLNKAEQMSFKTIKAEPENSTFLDTYAWILFIQKRYEEAKIYIEQAIKYDDDLSNVVDEHVGDIYYMTGETEKAIEYWNKSLNEGNHSETLKKKIKLRKYIKE